MAGKKTLDYYMALPYQEVIVAAKEGGYVGYIPELKGPWKTALIFPNRKMKMSTVVGLICVSPKAFTGCWL